MEEHVNLCIDGLAPAIVSTSTATTSSASTSTDAPDGKPSVSPNDHKVFRSPDPSPEITKDSKENGAFSVLMTSYKENEAWKEATIAEDRNFKPTKANGGRRKAPFYKVMQGMPIAVDAFRYGAIPDVTAYFLTYVVCHTANIRTRTEVWILTDTRIPIITPTSQLTGRMARYTAQMGQRI